jgi:hypothetical protein
MEKLLNLLILVGDAPSNNFKEIVKKGKDKGNKEY